MTVPEPPPATPHDRLDRSVRERLGELSRITASDGIEASGHTGDPATDTGLLGLFDAMAASRLLDLEARRMRERGEGYYTIGSAGHESNALIANALRHTDPALLHYRSGAFFIARALQAGRSLDDAVWAVLLGLAAASSEPASGGRHKVFGDASLAVIPQTSTIASHLPRAVGVAFAIGRAARLGLPTRWAPGSVVVCSFGDASINHSTAAGALNTAAYCTSQGLPLPIVFVCEDNGLGISVPTPDGWVAKAAQRPGVTYFFADGDDPATVSVVARDAAEIARTTNRPAFVHLRTVRYLGHAGTDVESGYRSPAAIAADLNHDPLIGLAQLIRGTDLARRYDALGSRIAELAAEAAAVSKLTTAAAVMAPLAPRDAAAIAEAARRRPGAETRLRVFDGKLPEQAGDLTLAQSINAALTDAMAAQPEVFVFGEDVGRKGGVYGVTRGLQQRFGAARVFDTLLDEQSILGMGLGFGVSGLVPIPEIQYLAYLHNAEDQLRGEAASLRFFSNGSFTNPLVVRVAGLAYQKGFGGHFHNDNALGVLRDIPGLVVAVPSRPEDAAPMLRACIAAAATDGQVSVFLEPIALYHERDLYEVGDRGWLGSYSPGRSIALGSGRTHGDGSDLTIVTFGNGVRMSLRVARRLTADKVNARVLDLRWVAPLPLGDLLREADATGRVLIVDETRHAGGVGEGIMTALLENGYSGRIARVSSRDSFVPLADAANLVLLGEDEIERAALRLVGRRAHRRRGAGA
ncbi:MAG TPA: thiamine pyrophosphate-dependent enzyme [Jatrophihabitantaceae bacterium]|nr:thiamine pyrophosphate-dependent enzyme [Jatrophihabitantaceae bacterium]